MSPNIVLGTVTTPAPSAHGAPASLQAGVSGRTEEAAEGTAVAAAEPTFGEGNRRRAANRILKEMKGWGSSAHRGIKFWFKGKTHLPSQAELLGNYLPALPHPTATARGLGVSQRRAEAVSIQTFGRFVDLTV